MKIQRRPSTASPSQQAFATLIKEAAFVEVNLQEYFASTQVRWVHISHTCIQEIQDWVEESLTLSPVPEVGGFFLGRYCETESSSYDLTVEQFIQAKEVNFNSPVVLDFGGQVLIEMDRVREQNPSLVNVGWFHTHPGHTPFLSGQDLSSHEGFFQKPFQIAIVLDSLTDSFDTGIFSRKKSGTMNNKEDRSIWISWKTLLTRAGNN